MRNSSRQEMGEVRPETMTASVFVHVMSLRYHCTAYGSTPRAGLTRSAPDCAARGVPYLNVKE